jgi:hypothetical protein
MAKKDHIAKFDRKTASAFAKEAEQALQALARKYGVDVSTGSGSYNDSNFTFKITAAVKSSDGTAITREAQAFKANARWIGLQESDLGRSFTSRGKTFTITGYNTRAKRMPILAKDENGKGFKFEVDTVKMLLKQAA